MSCKHINTNQSFKHGDHVCIDCGVVVYSVEENCCGKCSRAVGYSRKWTCTKNNCQIRANMRVTYLTKNGSCWKARPKKAKKEKKS